MMDDVGCYVCNDGIDYIHAETPDGGEWNGTYKLINYCFNCGRKLQDNDNDENIYSQI